MSHACINRESLFGCFIRYTNVPSTIPQILTTKQDEPFEVLPKYSWESRCVCVSMLCQASLQSQPICFISCFLRTREEQVSEITFSVSLPPSKDPEY